MLSRKGFDSVAGKGASPVLLDGRMVSMPIPEPRPTQGAGLTYEETLVPGDDVMSFAWSSDASVASSAPAQQDRLTLILTYSLAHDLGGRVGVPRSARPTPRPSHLRNQGVGAGDLFLFFGLFVPLTPGGLRRKEWFHSLFGYLQVDVVIDLHSDACPCRTGCATIRTSQGRPGRRSGQPSVRRGGAA